MSVWAGTSTTGGDVDVRAELDTTGGTGNWATTWYAKRPSDAGYTVIRPRATLLDPTIDSVGFATANAALQF